MKLKNDIRVCWSSPSGCPRPTARDLRHTGSTEGSSHTCEQPQGTLKHPRGSLPRPVHGGSTSKDKPEAQIWDLQFQTAFLVTTPFHCAKSTMWSVTENLFFPVSAALMLLKMLLNAFIFGITNYNYFSLSSSPNTQ